MSADLGWTDILYEAAKQRHPHMGLHQPGWDESAKARTLQGTTEALELIRDNHEQVLAFLEPLTKDDLTEELPPVQWLTDPFVIQASVNWGLSMHVDWHLIHLHEKRVALNKAMDWMASIQTV